MESLKTYRVEVQRISYSAAFIEVQAIDKKTAKELAINQAGDKEFTQYNCEHEITWIETV